MDTNQLWQFFLQHQAALPPVQSASVTNWGQTLVLIVGMIIGAIPIYYQNSKIHTAVNSTATALAKKYDDLNAAYLEISKTVSALRERDRVQSIKDAVQAGTSAATLATVAAVTGPIPSVEVPLIPTAVPK